MVKGLWGQPEIQLEITLLHSFQSGGWAASNAPRFGDPRLSGMVAEEGGPGTEKKPASKRSRSGTESSPQEAGDLTWEDEKGG